MPHKEGEILIIEDDEDYVELVKTWLQESDITHLCLTVIGYKEELIDFLQKHPPEMIISDYVLPDFTGLEALRYTRELYPNLPFILISGQIGEENTVDAMLEGASDYISKDNPSRLIPAVKRELINFRKLKNNEQDLKITRSRYKGLVQSVGGIVWEAEAETHNLNYVSPQTENILGYPSSAWYADNKFWENHIHPEDREETINIFNSKVRKGEDFIFDYRMIAANKDIIWLRDRVRVLKRHDKPTLLRGLKIDITTQRTKEIRLNDLLAEKELLLSEINHRVKNNLALISGMMQLQAFREGDKQLTKKLFANVSRIKTMAIVHELLYKSENFSRVKLDENLKKLVLSVIHTHEFDHPVTVEFSIEAIELNINQAIPLSLTINEVLADALENVEFQDESNKVHFKYFEDGSNVNMIIRMGNPSTIADTDSLGMTLIETLNKQLKGTFKYQKSDTGFSFALKFQKMDVKGSSNALMK